MGCRFVALFMGAALLASTAFAQGKILNIYNWSDYIAPETLKKFEAETGIKVRYDVYDNNEILEAKLIAGKTGYDLVAPTMAPFGARQIALGLYQPLQKDKLPNYGNLSPKIQDMLAVYDTGNAYTLPWMWGTLGVGYNVDKVKAAMPDAPTDSLRMVFDPAVVSRLKGCGVGMLDSATDILPLAMHYAGVDPNSTNPADLQKGVDVVTAVRPFIRKFHSSSYINELANGEMCVVLGFSGDIMQSKSRAAESNKGVNVNYSLPKEGTQVWVDVLAIPKDAQNVENAHTFLNYILRPEVIAANTNKIGYANGNEKATPLVEEAIRTDQQIYPTPEVMAKLFSLKTTTAAFDRQRTRAWQRILSGK